MLFLNDRKICRTLFLKKRRTKVLAKCYYLWRTYILFRSQSANMYIAAAGYSQQLRLSFDITKLVFSKLSRTLLIINQ